VSQVFRDAPGIHEVRLSSHMCRREVGQDERAMLDTKGAHTLRAKSQDKNICVDDSGLFPQKIHGNSGVISCLCK